MPISPSTDEDEGPYVGLPDEDAFAADASAPQGPGQKPKAKKQKKRKVEDPADGDSNIAMVSTPAQGAVPSMQHTHRSNSACANSIRIPRFTLHYP